jgi:hypothetical protein
MMIISFAWTTEALLRDLKNCTRRDWKDDYAKRFKAGRLYQAFDRSPRAGGERVGIIFLTCDPYKERLDAITDEEEKAEGGLWGSAEAFIEAYCKGARVSREHMIWVIRFDLVKIEPAGRKYLQKRD